MQSPYRNGVAHLSSGNGQVALAYDLGTLPPEPLDAVLDLGHRASHMVTGALIGAFILHAALVARAAVIPLDFMNWSRDIGHDIHYRLFETYEVELFKPPAVPLPTHTPEPEPVKEVAPRPPPAPVAVKDLEPPAAPAAAQAGAVLTADPDPDAPANFDGIISGTGETFAGGATSLAGTSTTAVHTMPVAVGGVPGGTGKAATGPAAVDRSRVASVAGSKDWNCPFPPEADSDQIDQAFPTIQVAVRADGTPERVTVLSDPGHGFGRAATKCAMMQRFDPALDRDGNPIPGLTKSLRVRFER